ncbi:acteyltransferase [Gloeomargarita lithophora Alchichica-D10]|uniref:Acteyltransferase n=1 Tax=Gloeomargarita lithophora Alchichica-D10 TaxID=1188229 RepID=A0A1J0AFP0_9CYAN|nr:GNAT family N-acetyltransferase [Gloeomargarita lithophora]APB34735.1 acteyltransferase [Gloeomargarita lithophora Alchichica-D10]
MVFIRKANRDDYESVLEYGLKIVRQHQDFNPRRFVQFPDHEQQLADFFREELSNPEAVILVAEYQEKIVGYALLRQEPASLIDLCVSAVWLHDIYIDESVRGLSVGKQLLQGAIQAAKQFGTPTLMLHVAAQNPIARDFFTAHGFEISVYEMMKNLDEN